MNTARIEILDDIYEIADKWRQQTNLSKEFLYGVLELSKERTAFYKMLNLWSESSPEDREEIIADLEEMFEDSKNRPSSPVDLPYVPMEKLSSIAHDITTYKSFLKAKVKEHGGVTVIARKCGISQPGLSRFLNSGTLPRKSTLEKLAKALKLTQKEMTFEWSR